jgi:predicted TIM-barrel fold metal-dependent hydrolase
MRQPMGRRVDVHVHYLPPPYIEALTGRSDPPRIDRSNGELTLDLGPGGSFPLQAEMIDLERHREGMADTGVDTAILSIIPPAVDGFDPANAVAVARASNDALADLSSAQPTRFAAMATLPAVDPERAADELRRAVGLGLRAGVLLTNVGGARLDEQGFRPIFATAAELDVPIVLHPTVPAQPEPYREYGLMTIVGFIMETTLCALRLVLSGLYERHPDFKLVVPHVGASIPFLLGRIEYEVERYQIAADVLSAPVDEHLRRMYLDSVSAWPGALRLALDAFGPDHLLLGTDAPFWARAKNVDALVEVGAADDVLEKVSAGNADRVFGVG